MPPVGGFDERIRRLYLDRKSVEVAHLPGQQAPLTPKHLTQRWEDYAEARSHDRRDPALYDLGSADSKIQKLLSPTERTTWAGVKIVQVPNTPLRAKAIRRGEETVLLISAPYILFLRFFAQLWTRWMRSRTGAARCPHFDSEDYAQAWLALSCQRHCSSRLR
jgi:hypothetical protein